MKFSTALPRFGCAAVCAGLAAAVACGCTPKSTPASSAAAASDSAAGTPAQSEASSGAQTDTQNTASALPDDGELRMYSYSQANGTTVLCGNSVICKGGPTDTLSLLMDNITSASDYYLHAWNDSSLPSGRRCAIYDKTGAEVLAFDEEVRASLNGSYLITYSDLSIVGDGDLAAPGSMRVFKLSNGKAEEIAVPANAVSCCAAGDHLAFTIYNMPEGVQDMYDDSGRFAHCTVQVQDKDGSVVAEYTGCTASSLYGSSAEALQNWLYICYYTVSGADWGYEETNPVLTRPSDGLVLENYVQLCGGGTACFKTENGQYELVDLSGEQPAVLGTFDGSPTDYFAGKVCLWQDETPVLQDLATGEQTPLYCSYHSADRFGAYTADGTLLLYDADTGEELMRTSVTFDTPAENGYTISAIGGSYVWLQKYGGANSGSEIKVCGSDGSVKDITSLTEKYQYISDLAMTDSGPIFSASYSGAGGSTLYDVLDCEGNVLLHGLSNCYTVYSTSGAMPYNCFYARRGYYYGWMNSSGEWLYREYIFDTLSADDGMSYIYG